MHTRQHSKVGSVQRTCSNLPEVRILHKFCCVTAETITPSPIVSEHPASLPILIRSQAILINLWAVGHALSLRVLAPFHGTKSSTFCSISSSDSCRKTGSRPAYFLSEITTTYLHAKSRVCFQSCSGSRIRAGATWHLFPLTRRL